MSDLREELRVFVAELRTRAIFSSSWEEISDCAKLADDLEKRFLSQNPLESVLGTFGGPAWEELLEMIQKNREEEQEA